MASSEVLFSRFQKLEMAQAQRLEAALGHASPYSFSASQERQARRKNRYADILPFDGNRVKLRHTPDYINGSSIKCHGTSWIASQGPLQSTCLDFWQMVLENSSLIIMLCNVQEANVDKCAQYWPSAAGTSMEFDDPANDRHCSVQCTSQMVDEGAQATISNIEIKASIGRIKYSKQVVHIHYQTWPDHGSSDVKTLVKLVELVAALKCKQQNSDERPVVHCSAGCGRTGTFIALSALARDPSLEIDRLVDDLRKQRIASVQSLSQFRLLHQFVDVVVT